MLKRKFPKFIHLFLCFLLIFQQFLSAGRQEAFAQIAGQLDISGHLAAFRNTLISSDTFRPLHLRYLSYDSIDNNFKLLLDKGGSKNPRTQELENTSKELLKYFFIGISLPNDSFWVNLRPDAEDNIIDDYLARTDIGKIMLESDLQLKKDTAKATSPETPEGRKYWDKLYKKAGELFGPENITIPTLTRPWIVPDEIIIRETVGVESESRDGLNRPYEHQPPSAYIYKATLKVMLEQDYLKDSSGGLNLRYNFDDSRSKALNEYSSQLIRELVIPKLTKEINTSKRYAPLRQVYYSLILAQWFKARNKQVSGRAGLNLPYLQLIDSRNLANLTSKTPWSKTTYFKEYQKSFKGGEYNIQQPIYTSYGQSIRSYFSGGMIATSMDLDLALRSPTAKAGNVMVGLAVNDFSANSSPFLAEMRIQANNPGEIIVRGEGDSSAATPAVAKLAEDTHNFVAQGIVAHNTFIRGQGTDNRKTKIQKTERQEDEKTKASISSVVEDKSLTSSPAESMLSKEDELCLEDIRSNHQTAGDYLDSLLKLEEIDKDNFIWRQFAHYLNSSNWLGAAKVLYAKKEFFKKIRKNAVLTTQKAQAMAIEALFSKLEDLNQKELQWLSRRDFHRWFVYGTYFLLEDEKEKLEKGYYDAALEFFSQLQVYNVIFKPPVFSLSGALIGVEQDHNWAYFYWKKAQQMGLLPASDPSPFQQKKTKTVLFHYDAHHDIGDKFEEVVFIPPLTKEADYDKDLAEIVQERLGISNFIIPATGEGLVDEVVWVVPSEALEVNGYKIFDYGAYELLVERIKTENGGYMFSLVDRFEPEGSFEEERQEKQAQLERLKRESGDQEEIEILSWQIDRFVNTRMVRVYIVSPADIQTLRNIAENATHMILDVDEDVTGTSHPLEKKSAPHFLTSENRCAELLNNLEDFYSIQDVQDKTRVISIVNSPGFTYQSEQRNIAARLLGFFANSAMTPSWVKEERRMAEFRNITNVNIEYSTFPTTSNSASDVSSSAVDESFGLCLTPDSMIHLADGTTKPLIDLKPFTNLCGSGGLEGDMVLSLNEATGKLEPHRVNALLDMGVKPVYRIRTKSGKELKTTLNHPYLTKDGWRKLKDIKTGDEIACLAGRRAVAKDSDLSAINLSTVPDFGDEYFISRQFKDSPVIVNTEAVNFTSSSRKGFGKIQGLRGAKEIFHLFYDPSLNIIGKLTQLSFGVGGKLIGNHNPKRFFTTEAGMRPEFLDFSSDLENAGLNDSISSINLPNSSINVFGRNHFKDSATLRKSSNFFKSSSGSSGFFNPALNSLGFQAISNFLSRIDSKVMISYSNSSLGWAARIILDKEKNGIVASNCAITPPKVSSSILKLPQDRQLSRLFLPEAEAAQVPENSINSGILWDKIVSIEPLGPMQVYDIEVEGTHNFVAQGIVAHNTYQNAGDREQGTEKEPTAFSAISDKGGIDGSADSPSIPRETNAPGGIDFRALPIVTRAMSNLSLNVSRIPLSSIEGINLDQELREIQRLVEAGITPSAERIREYVYVSCLKGNSDMRKVVSCITDILRLEEERGYLTDTTLKDVLVVLESGRPIQELKAVFTGANS